MVSPRNETTWITIKLMPGTFYTGLLCGGCITDGNHWTSRKKNVRITQTQRNMEVLFDLQFTLLTWMKKLNFEHKFVVYWSLIWQLVCGRTAYFLRIFQKMCQVPLFGYCPRTPEQNRNTVTNRNAGWLLIGGAMPNLFPKRIGLVPKMGIFYSTPY